MKSIEEIREAFETTNSGLSEGGEYETVSAALDELAALRLEVSALKCGVGNGQWYSRDGDDPLTIFDADAEDVCRAANEEMCVQLLAVLNADNALRDENAKLRDAIKKRGESGHTLGCSFPHARAACICGADEWNALVRGMQ